MINEGYQPKAPKSAPIPPRGEGDTIRIREGKVKKGGVGAHPNSPPPRLYNGAGVRVDSKAKSSVISDFFALCIAIILCFCIGFALGVAFSG